MKWKEIFVESKWIRFNPLIHSKRKSLREKNNFKMQFKFCQSNYNKATWNQNKRIKS